MKSLNDMRVQIQEGQECSFGGGWREVLTVCEEEL